MVKRRSSRQDAIRDILRKKSLYLQRELQAELQGRGFECTQATISRDMADMDIRKRPDGAYVLAEDQHLQRMVSEFVAMVRRVNNLVVITCEPGTAAGVSAAIAAVGIPEVIGAIADNQEVLVVAATDEGAGRIVKKMKDLRHPQKRRRRSIG